MLAVSRDYHESYFSQAMQENFPEPLMNLKKDYGQLLSLAIQTDVNVTKNNIRVVETQTQNQYKSRLWNRMRAGRVTESKLKAVCHTDPVSLSVSLVMSICHQELHRFETSATRWGRSHEKRKPLSASQRKEKICTLI